MQHWFLWFWVWVTSLRMVMSNSIFPNFSFFFMAELNFTVSRNHALIIRSWDNGHLGLFHVLAIVQRAEMDMDEHVSSGTMLGIISSILKNIHLDFHCGCTGMPFYQQWITVSFPTFILAFIAFLSCLKKTNKNPQILAFLTWVRWNLTVVLMFISLITKNT